MRRSHLIIILVVLLALVAGAGMLGTLPLPAPTQKVEKVIPDDRIGK